MEGLDLKYIFKRIIHSWWIFFLLFIVFMTIATVYLKNTMQEYEVSSVVLVKGNGKNSQAITNTDDGGLLMNGLVLNGFTDVNNEIQIMKGGGLLTALCDSLHLNISCRNVKTKKPMLRKEIPILLIPKKKTENSSNAATYKVSVDFGKNIVRINNNSISLSTLKQGKVSYGDLEIVSNIDFENLYSNMEYEMSLVSNEIFLNRFSKVLSITLLDNDASSVNVSLMTFDKSFGKKILNTLLYLYIQNNKIVNGEIADSTISFVNSRIDSIKKELSLLDKSIVSFRQQKHITDIALQSRDYLDYQFSSRQKVADNTVELTKYRNLKQLLISNSVNDKLLPSDLVISNSNIAAFISQYNELILKKKELLLTATNQNAYIKTIDSQLLNFKQAILESLDKEISNESLALNVNNAGYENNNQMLAKMPENERTYLLMVKRQDLLNNILNTLIKKREDAYVSKVSSLGNVRILSPAETSSSPVSPKRTMVWAAASLFSIFFSLLIVFIKDTVTGKGWYPDNIEKKLGIKYLGHAISFKDHSDVSLVRNTLFRNWSLENGNNHYLFWGDCLMSEKDSFGFMLACLKSMQQVTKEHILIIDLSANENLYNITTFQMPIDFARPVESLYQQIEDDHDNNLVIVQPKGSLADKELFLTSTYCKQWLSTCQTHFDKIVIYNKIKNLDGLLPTNEFMDGFKFYVMNLNKVNNDFITALSKTINRANTNPSYFVNVTKV